MLAVPGAQVTLRKGARIRLEVALLRQEQERKRHARFYRRRDDAARVWFTLLIEREFLFTAFKAA